MLKRTIKVISIVIILTLILLGYYFLNLNFKIYVPCIFHEITGLNCPGCGITRALFSLIQGNIKLAFSYNKLVFFLAPFVFVYAIIWLYSYISDKKNNILKSKAFKILELILIIITILYGIVRNIKIPV